MSHHNHLAPAAPVEPDDPAPVLPLPDEPLPIDDPEPTPVLVLPLPVLPRPDTAAFELLKLDPDDEDDVPLLFMFPGRTAPFAARLVSYVPLPLICPDAVLCPVDMEPIAPLVWAF